MNDSDIKLAAALIDLVKALVWPALVIWLVLRFRIQVTELLTRLGSFRVPGGEFVFQQASVHLLPAVQSKRMVSFVLGPDGFLTLRSLHGVVSDFAGLDAEEPITGELLIFQTPRQRTWLIVSARQLFVVLDDETTRKNKNLVQTVLGLDNVLPLDFGVSQGAGIVKFAAEGTWWFYSLHIFASTAALDTAVRRLTKMAA
jgi:hypothetical protein